MSQESVAAATVIALPSVVLRLATTEHPTNVSTPAVPLGIVAGDVPFTSAGGSPWRVTLRGLSFHPQAVVHARCRLVDDEGVVAEAPTLARSQQETVCLFRSVSRATKRNARVAYSHDGAFFGPRTAPFAVVGTAASLVILRPTQGTVVPAAASMALPTVEIAVADAEGNPLQQFSGRRYNLELRWAARQALLASGVTSVDTGAVSLRDTVLARPTVGPLALTAEAPGLGWRVGLIIEIVPGPAAALQLDVSTTTWLYGATRPLVLQPPPSLRCVDGAGNVVTDAAALPVSVLLTFQRVREPTGAAVFSSASDNITDTRLELRRGTRYAFGSIAVMGAHGQTYHLRFSAPGMDGIAPLSIAVGVKSCGPSMFAVAGSTACQVCPANAVCDGTTVARPQSGFWHGASSSLTFYECRDGGAACIDGGLCAEGFTGPLCSVCADGYGDASSKCRSCPATGLAWAAVSAIAVACVVGLFVFVELSVRSGRVALIAQMRITMTYLQLLSGAVLSAEALPDAAAKALEAIGAIVSLDITTVLFGCTFATSYYQLYIVFMLFIPIFVVFFSAVTGIGLVLRQYMHWAFRSDRAQKLAQRLGLNLLLDANPAATVAADRAQMARSVTTRMMSPTSSPLFMAPMPPHLPSPSVRLESSKRTPVHRFCGSPMAPLVVVDNVAEWTPPAEAPVELPPPAMPLALPALRLARVPSAATLHLDGTEPEGENGRQLRRRVPAWGGSIRSSNPYTPSAPGRNSNTLSPMGPGRNSNSGGRSSLLRFSAASPSSSRRTRSDTASIPVASPHRRRRRHSPADAHRVANTGALAQAKAILVRWLERSVAAFFVVSFVLYPTVVKYSGRLLVCEEIDYGPVLGRRSLPSYRTFFTVAVLLLVSFGVGFPAMALGLIRLFSRYSSDPERTARMLQFVVGGYEPHLWFWEGVMLARKAANFGISDTSLRSYVMMWTVAAGFALDVSFRPFRHPGQQLVDVLQERDAVKSDVARTHRRSALIRDAITWRLSRCPEPGDDDEPANDAVAVALGRLVEGYEPLLNVTPLLFACPVYTAEHMAGPEERRRSLERSAIRMDKRLSDIAASVNSGAPPGDPSAEAIAYAAAIFAYEQDIMRMVRGVVPPQHSAAAVDRTLRRNEEVLFPAARLADMEQRAVSESSLSVASMTLSLSMTPRTRPLANGFSASERHLTAFRVPSRLTSPRTGNTTSPKSFVLPCPVVGQATGDWSARSDPWRPTQSPRQTSYHLETDPLRSPVSSPTHGTRSLLSCPAPYLSASAPQCIPVPNPVDQ